MSGTRQVPVGGTTAVPRGPVGPVGVTPQVLTGLDGAVIPPVVGDVLVVRSPLVTVYPGALNFPYPAR